MKTRRYFFVLSSFFMLGIMWKLGLWSNTLTKPAESILNKTTKLSSEGALGKNRSSISKRPRILCWILTGPENHFKKSIHVKRTWGSRCDKLLFMSSVQDSRLGAVALEGVAEGHQNLWPKTQKAFQYVWEHHRNDADWFIKADDDTFVFVDNLRKFLKDFDPNDPHYFGYPYSFYPNVSAINFGGAGYVLSREAVRRFVEIALVKGGDCFTGIRPKYKGDEDTEMGTVIVFEGLCLRSVGVTPERAMDERGQNRFGFGNPLSELFAKPSSYEQLWGEVVRTSKRAISFHYVKPQELYIYEYLSHYLKTAD